jgi:hypothetical protein
MTQLAAGNKPQPWKPADATDAIRTLVTSEHDLYLTGHAKSQMLARDLILSDLRHVLKFGFVYEDPMAATQPGCFKYEIESTTPEGARVVRLIAIPWVNPPHIKIVTVMWRDEGL